MINIKELLGESRGRGSHRCVHADRITVSLAKAGGNRTSLAIGVSEETMKKVRWVIGDRVTMDLDIEEHIVTIRRVVSTSDEASWKLSNRNGGKKADGVVASATLKISVTPVVIKALNLEDYTAPRIIREYVISENGVTFSMK